MKKLFVMTSALGVACLLAWSATGQPPGGGQPPKGEQKGGKGGDFKGGKGGDFKGGKGFPGGPGGPGGFGMRMGAPGQILPGFLQEMLKLTEDQKKQVADLQKEVDDKIAKILTDDQKKQLKELSERGPGGFPGGPGGFPGGPGGFPGGPGGFPGGPGGPGGKGGNPPPKKDPPG